jgi:hypothetical protein
MRARALLVAIAYLSLGPSVGVSQNRPFGPVPSPLFVATPTTGFRTAFSAERGDSARLEIEPTHWKKGAVIGGVVGALSGLLLAHAVCGLSEEAGHGCPTSGTLLMAMVGGGSLLAIPGALIGGQFAKPEE